MPFGLLTGLGAALSWGTMDIASALASRRIGSLLVTAGVLVTSATLLAVIAIATGTALPSDAQTLATSTLLGCIGAGAYLSYFTGLRIGPIAVVSGMVAAYGGLTVVLSVALRGETLTTTQALGATLATVGVILTGVAFHGGWRATRFAGPGVVFAVVALVLFAMMAITTDVALESAGWIQVLLVSRLVTSLIAISTVGVFIVLARRGLATSPGSVPGATVAEAALPLRRGRVLAAILVAGLLDVLGLVSFAIGLESAPTWMVGLASSFGPAVTILVAVALLGERLRPIQWLGLVGVAAGMVAIALP
jgi:uncharacterized membrane protein